MLINTEILREAKFTYNIREAFRPADRVTSISELYLQYTSAEPKAENMHKVLFYMLLCEEFGLPVMRTKEHDYGYKLVIRNDYNL